MGFRNVFSTPSALNEFGQVARLLHPFMVDPELSRDAKREMLSKHTNLLSEKTFQNTVVVDQIMKIINMKEDICKEYKDTDTQVNGIIAWFPRMNDHKDRLTKEVAKHRKEYGLKV